MKLRNRLVAAALVIVAANAWPINQADLATYVDGFVEARMSEHGVVGATVSVVQGGRVVFAKGYGYDNLEAGRPVEADRSLFRPGSISKTFTWTAVMQLHEQGLLDLEADVQQYVPDIELPRRFGKPITMLDLMAHKPGLEDSALGHLFEADATNVLPLADYLASHQPQQVRAPGTLASYSNYGSGIAGLIVANLSGQTFEDYVEAHVTGPIGMRRSTFREPGLADHRAMPEALAGDVSRGYIRIGADLESSDFVHIAQIAPAGGLSTTAADMGRWMLAHLGDGAYGGGRILRADTAQRMHSQQYTPHPLLPGAAHGFIETDVHGYRAYGHGGGTVHFLSDMVIIPEIDVGIFISTNTTTAGSKLISEFARHVVKRYFPQGPNTLPALDVAGFDTQPYLGNYIFSRRSHSTVERLNLPMVQIGTAGGGRISFGNPARPFEAVAEHVFQSVENPDLKLAFFAGDDGRMAGFYPPVAIMVAERAGLLDNPQVVFGWLSFAVLVFLCVLIGAFLRRKRTGPQSAGERRAAWAVYLTASAWIVTVAGIGIAFAQITADFRNVFFDFPSQFFRASLTAAIVATVLTAAAVLTMRPAIAGSSWSGMRRMRHVLVVVVALITVYVLYRMNAIGYHYF